MIGIYKITSPTGRVYIGQATDIEFRKRMYVKEKCVRQPKIYRSLKKYGWEAHVFEIVEECEISQLNTREGYWQKFYDCVKTGLNCRQTGEDGNSGYDSEETKQKRSKALMGRKRPPEVVEKMRAPRPHTAGKNHNLSKPVENYVTGAYYDSCTEAAKKEGINQGTLQKYLTGNCPDSIFLRFANIEDRPENPRATTWCKILLDTETGVFYYSLKEAVEHINFTKKQLIRMLKGKIANKTSLIYTE